MNICENGHYWDPSIYSSCPYCSGVTGSVNRSLNDSNKTVPLTSNIIPGPTVPINESPKTISDHTVPVNLVTNVNPVVGWLVAISGPHKGECFSLYNNYNYIGRNKTNSVSLSADSKVSAEKNVYVAYDSDNNSFYTGAGESTNIPHYNGKALKPGQPMDLSPYDELKIGDSKLLFIPFCTDKFQWTEADAQTK